MSVTTFDIVATIFLITLLLGFVVAECAKQIPKLKGRIWIVSGLGLFLLGKLIILGQGFGLVSTLPETARLIHDLFNLGGIIAVVFGIIVLIRQEVISRNKKIAGLEDTIYWYDISQRVGQVGHWVWDEIAEKDIAYSEETRRIYGLADKETVLNWDEFLETVHPDDRNRVKRTMNVKPMPAEGYECSYRVVDSDGSVRHILEHGIPDYNAQGLLLKTVGTVQDISIQKIAEEELEKAIIDAERANLSKSKFLASMSHELRTPLNAIIGFSELISKKHFGDNYERYESYAKIIHTSGQHLLSLVNDILDLSAVEAGSRTLNMLDTDIAPILETCIELMEPKTAFKNLSLHAHVADDLPTIFADERSIQQILINLLNNSVKYTLSGGSITIDVSSDSQSCMIAVSDTGIGIPADKLPTITEPFMMVENDPHMAQEGTGLGLAIVKSLVKLHDGVLNIKSEEGVGTTVTVKLPCQPVAADQMVVA